MGLFSNKIDRSSLQRGDHIYCYRKPYSHLYSHHGIFVGNNRVIHLTRTQEPESSNDFKGLLKFSSGSSHSSLKGSVKRCEVCGYEPEKHRGVVECCLECFLKGDRLFRFEYNVSKAHFLLKLSGTCTTIPCIFSPDDVILRARKILKSTEGFGDYDLTRNNCETFAIYCKTGKRMSTQANSWKPTLSR